MFLKVLDEECKPFKGSKYSSFIDLRSAKDCVIRVGRSAMIGLGVRIDHENLNRLLGSVCLNAEDFKKSHYLQLSLRSSLAKEGLIIPNGVGIMDIDYKGEIKLMVHNTFRASGKGIRINKGDRIAQISIISHKCWLMGVESEEERRGGFGSTGR